MTITGGQKALTRQFYSEAARHYVRAKRDETKRAETIGPLAQEYGWEYDEELSALILDYIKRTKRLAETQNANEVKEGWGKILLGLGGVVACVGGIIAMVMAGRLWIGVPFLLIPALAVMGKGSTQLSEAKAWSFGVKDL